MKKYWIEKFVEHTDGSTYKACYECNSYYFQKERLGKAIVMDDCNNADSGRQYKRKQHERVEKHFSDKYIETVIFEKGTDNVILKIVG